MSIAVVGFGLIIGWAALGLFMDIDNGWTETLPECLTHLNNSLASNLTEYDGRPLSVPTALNGLPLANFCSLNQWWFNYCVKAFVVLFSYINFLPIPWRVSILQHVYCSKRPSHEGVDFYGRPTDALWFNIAKSTRRRVAVLLNLAWMFHFTCLATHIVWSEYIQGQTWPTVLYHNLPFVLSVTCQIAAGVTQSRAEKRLILEQPDRFPPRPMMYVAAGFRKWRRREAQGAMPPLLPALHAPSQRWPLPSTVRLTLAQARYSPSFGRSSRTTKCWRALDLAQRCLPI